MIMANKVIKLRGKKSGGSRVLELKEVPSKNIFVVTIQYSPGEDTYPDVFRFNTLPFAEAGLEKVLNDCISQNYEVVS